MSGHRLDSMKSQRTSAGHDITQLAKKANVSDWAIRKAESGGTVSAVEGQRIADALGVSLATLGKNDI